jgi:hypothetical protein
MVARFTKGSAADDNSAMIQSPKQSEVVYNDGTNLGDSAQDELFVHHPAVSFCTSHCVCTRITGGYAKRKIFVFHECLIDVFFLTSMEYPKLC